MHTKPVRGSKRRNGAGVGGEMAFSIDDKELVSKIHHEYIYRISRLISSLHKQTTCTPQRIYVITKRLALNFRELSLVVY